MKKAFLICIFGALAFGLFLFWGYAHSESYCFFYPNIDTRYAPGFTESGFSQITTGMTAQAVEKLIGTPFSTSRRSDGAQHWFYSQDGKAFFGDWAWFGREIVLRDDKVVEVLRTIYYD